MILHGLHGLPDQEDESRSAEETDGLHEEGDVPTPVPRSSELSTRIDRSGLTLPMICTALPLERWASCRVGTYPYQLTGSGQEET